MSSILITRFFISCLFLYMLKAFDLFSQLPEFFLALTFCFFLVWFPGLKTILASNGKVVRFVSLPLVLTIQSTFLLFCLSFNNPLVVFYSFSGTLISTYLISCSKTLLSFLVFLCVACSFSFFKKHKYFSFEFFGLFLLSTLACLLLFSSNDFVVLYLALELQTLCFYSLSAFKRNFYIATEAGVKYFIIGAFSSAVVLLGISLLYGSLGTLSLSDIEKLFLLFTWSKIPVTTLLGLVLIFTGISFKTVLAPFHFWAIEVYEGVSTPIALFFSVAGKFTIMILLVKLCFLCFLELKVFLKLFFSAIAFLCFFFGSFTVLVQRKLKRFFVLSSVTHSGFMLAALSVFNLKALFSFLFYLLFYLLISYNIWLVLLLIEDYKGKLFKGFLQNLYNLRYQNPFLAGMFSVLIFSIAGIPPLIGFGIKFISFYVVLEAGFWFIAGVALCAAIISSFYYLKLIKNLLFVTFFYKNKCFSKVFSNIVVTRWQATSMSVSLLFMLLPFFYPSLVMPFFFYIIV